MQIPLVLIEFTKSARKEMLHPQCTIRGDVTPFYKLTGLT